MAKIWTPDVEARLIRSILKSLGYPRIPWGEVVKEMAKEGHHFTKKAVNQHWAIMQRDKASEAGPSTPNSRKRSVPSSGSSNKAGKTGAGAYHDNYDEDDEDDEDDEEAGFDDKPVIKRAKTEAPVGPSIANAQVDLTKDGVGMASASKPVIPTVEAKNGLAALDKKVKLEKDEKNEVAFIRERSCTVQPYFNNAPVKLERAANQYIEDQV
ncbi:hypothetical protein C8034_v009087 [Colletotrichum sidae]|uniref:Myb-like domain-containing protein n=1 Tax=Colletotrichum sidae TaxID=1347389 RepID=A0A4R8TH73_9PEZI|nr:hypothetical protein C8034_v009087 [Colletotrichum sidae]